MSAQSITQSLFQVTRFRFVNAYLVREEDGFTLVDTSVPGSAKVLLEAARELGAPIRRIALTHGHGDHVGSLDALKQQLGPEVEVLMPELDARILGGEAFAEKKPPGHWPKIQTSPDVRLSGGERVGSLEVVPTPGHTPGHVAFLDTRDRTLIAGDTLTTFGGVAVPGRVDLHYPLGAPAALGTWDKQHIVDSARRLRALEPTLLVVGHGPPVRQPGEGMDRAIARLDRR